MGTKDILDIKTYVIKLISYYPRTTYEIRQKLSKNSYHPEDIEKAIRELERKKYLDDEKYCSDWLEKQLKYRPCGKIRCRALLMKRGVDRDLADSVIDSKYDDETELHIAKSAARKKHRELIKKSSNGRSKIKQKIAYHLQNKGFSSEAIMEIINNTLWE